eukprot:UN03341
MIDWNTGNDETYKQRKNSIKLNESTTQTLFDDNDSFFNDINDQNNVQQNNQKHDIMDLFNDNNQTKTNSNTVQLKSNQPQQNNIFTSFEYPQQQQTTQYYQPHNKQQTVHNNNQFINIDNGNNWTTFDF